MRRVNSLPGWWLPCQMGDCSWRKQMALRRPTPSKRSERWSEGYTAAGAAAPLIDTPPYLHVGNREFSAFGNLHTIVAKWGEWGIMDIQLSTCPDGWEGTRSARHLPYPELKGKGATSIEILRGIIQQNLHRITTGLKSARGTLQKSRMRVICSDAPSPDLSMNKFLIHLLQLFGECSDAACRVV